MRLTLVAVRMGKRTVMSQEEAPCAGTSEDIESSSNAFYRCAWKYLSEKYPCFSPEGNKDSCEKETEDIIYQEVKDVYLKGFKKVCR